MLGRFLDLGIKPTHLWGMTETSPVATALAPRPDWEAMDREAQLDVICCQGAAPFGVELRIVDDDDAELPRDGVTSGRLQVRGPWIVKRYFGAEADAVDVEGWFDTGDVAILHPDGTMQITDRAKDVIKSGGEWISSIDLENLAVGHPKVAEAAVIGVSHPKWDERPLLVIVLKKGETAAKDEILGFMQGKVAKWWMPDDVVFVDEIPHTATGKIQKLTLRHQFKDYRLPNAQAAE